MVSFVTNSLNSVSRCRFLNEMMPSSTIAKPMKAIQMMLSRGPATVAISGAEHQEQLPAEPLQAQVAEIEPGEDANQEVMDRKRQEGGKSPFADQSRPGDREAQEQDRHRAEHDHAATGEQEDQQRRDEVELPFQRQAPGRRQEGR